ncbi:MAG: TadE/TadG family type IV pilus assembly protein [Cyanobacteria bacterium J06639_18]
MDRLAKLTFITPRLRRSVEAWAEDKRGATAVEFALVALPFFFLLFGLIEIAVVFIMFCDRSLLISCVENSNSW